jgi:fluoroacetyl-CoA thioesterase
MKNIFEVGHTMRLVHTVEQGDLATFETGNVHPFYSTFALGRDAEWACRQFVLQMKEDDEEGIGTFLNIRHKSPAMLGDTVEFIATVSLLEGHQIDCSFVAKVGDRIVAKGEQGQKILKKEKLDRLVNQIING